jgi:hypothetical protein
VSDQAADWQDKVMHTTLTLDGQLLMGGDVAPSEFEAPKGFPMSLTMKSQMSWRRTAMSSWRCRERSGPTASPTSSIVSGSRGRSTTHPGPLCRTTS